MLESTTLRTRIESLVTKMDALAVADPERQIFGAIEHDWARLAPLSEADVRRLEAERDVRFPEDHRYYLTTVSAGGAGPYYGLVPLTEADDLLRRHVGSAVSPRWGAPFDPMRADAPIDDANEDESVARPGPHGYDGCVFVAKQGCGYFSVLVLTGEHAGEVWSEMQEGGGALAPEAKSFLEWMEWWADRALVEWASDAAVAAADACDRSLLDSTALAMARPLLEALAVEGGAQIVRALAFLHALAGEGTSAAELVEVAASRETDEPEARRHLDRARLARLRDDFEEVERETAAIARFERLWYTTEQRARRLRIDALTHLGRDDEALEERDALAGSAYFELEPHLDVARAYAARDRWEDVERVLRRAADLGAGAPPGAEKHRLTPFEKAIQVILPLLPWIDVEYPVRSSWVRELLASFNELSSVP